MGVPFWKMQGAGNDFVVIDHRVPFLPEGAVRARLVAAWCDRRRGIGSDGVLLLERDPEGGRRSGTRQRGSCRRCCGRFSGCQRRTGLFRAPGRVGRCT